LFYLNFYVILLQENLQLMSIKDQRIRKKLTSTESAKPTLSGTLYIIYLINYFRIILT